MLLRLSKGEHNTAATTDTVIYPNNKPNFTKELKII